MTMTDHDSGIHFPKGKAGRKAARAARKALRALKNHGTAAFPDLGMADSPSLLDALRERPGDIPGTTRVYRPLVSSPSPLRQLPPPMWTDNAVTVRPLWTPAEYRTYERLTAISCSPVISEAAQARVWLKKFVEKHGREKCAMMMAEIRRRDAAEWFKENQKGPKR